LNLSIYVQPSKIFQRRSDTIYAKTLVDPIDAIIGGRIKIPTPYGVKEVELKSNTANGEEITVSGFGIKGIKHRMFGANNNGDLVVTIIYARPKKYSKQQIEQLKNVNMEINHDVEKFNEEMTKEIG
jgi:molecular chaperone DnaJ